MRVALEIRDLSIAKILICRAVALPLHHIFAKFVYSLRTDFMDESASMASSNLFSLIIEIDD